MYVCIYANTHEASWEAEREASSTLSPWLGHRVCPAHGMILLFPCP